MYARMYKMRILPFICALIVFTGTSTPATLDGSKALYKKLSDVHYQLFNSIQRGMNMLTSAQFETSCTKMGCTITKYQATRSATQSIHVPKLKGCKKGWKEYNGHCYMQPSISLNWFNAQMYCRKYNAHLAKVDDKNENDWISHAFPDKTLYTDFTDLGTEGVWRSFTFGDEALYTNWIKGNPSNTGSNEHCVEMNCEQLGLWNDVPCKDVRKIVCESYGYME